MHMATQKDMLLLKNEHNELKQKHNLLQQEYANFARITKGKVGKLFREQETTQNNIKHIVNN